MWTSRRQPAERCFLLGVSHFLFYLLVFAGASAGIAASAQAPADLPVASPAPAAGEDLAQLSLTGHPLALGSPFLVQRDELPEFTRELLRVEWRPGDPIDLYVIRPTHAPKPPVTIFLYGFPSETDRFRDNDYCRLVTRRGYAAVGFVSALTGQRFHGRGLKDWFVSDLPEALVTSVHDVQMVLNYLDTRTDLDASSVGMFGQGSGGSIAVLAASVDARLARIDLIDPWGDWPAWMAGSPMILDEERPQLQSDRFLNSVSGLDPVKFLPGLSPSRVRLVDVSYDRDTPPPAKHAIEAAIPKGAPVLSYATPAEFKAGVGESPLQWLQPPLTAAETENPGSKRTGGGRNTQ